MNEVLFQMHSALRSELVSKHEFYIRQAKKRLLSQFKEEDIRQEADLEGERFLEENQRHFNPDVHDGSEFHEMAGEARSERYQLLLEMRNSIRMSIIAGLFHEWEKNLRQWLVDEVQHWHYGEEAKSIIWKKNVSELFELLESFGWPLKSAPYFKDLDACRLIVNVYKHGEGNSLNELDQSYPQFLDHPFEEMRGTLGKMWFSPSYEYLRVEDDDLEAFSDAILRFWKDVPNNVLNNQITNPPSWLVKAIKKDQSNQNFTK